MGTPFDFFTRSSRRCTSRRSRRVSRRWVIARISCFYARVAVESAVTWAFEHDRTLPRPYDAGLSTLLHEPAFKALMGDQVFRKAKEVIRLGNRAAHDTSPPSNRDAVAAVSHLFEFLYWFGRTYIRGEKPPADLRFDPRTLPPPAPNPLRDRGEDP